ncbi:MAG: hypothetical protein WKF75_00030 [Singulisphaera sp.]
MTTRGQERGAGGTFRRGEILFGTYEVVRELGRGGMGIVLLVRNLRLDVERALKLIGVGGGLEDDALERFRREARVMARLAHHPNIAIVHRADVDVAGRLGSSRWNSSAAGRSRRCCCRGCRCPGLDRPPAGPALRRGQSMHEQGIVHRD